MRKTISAIISIFLAFSISYAQDYPDFGNPSKEEIELKECPFEKEAGAVVLMHEAFSYSEDNQRLITTHHIRIKALKQSGVNVANVSIPFFRFKGFERITNIEALTINFKDDGEIVKQKITKKLFYTSKINELTGEINFAFPSVKAGSIIEYQYRSVMEYYFGLRDWYFQSNIPVMTSRYHLKMIPNKKFSYKIFKSPKIELTVLPEKDRIFFQMQNIPSLTAEPYMDAKEDYLQRLNFFIGEYNSRWGSSQVSEFTSSWKNLNSQMLNHKFFGRQIMSTISGSTGFIDSTKLLKSEEEKMNKIYGYVKNRMTWNGVNDFLSDDVNKVWEKQTGSCGDINMLLMNLLNEAQLNVYPLLVSKRFNGKVDSTYPNSDQFNSLLACVNINNKKYILDATEKYYPSNIIPESVLNTNGFMIDRISGELLNIVADTITYKEIINLEMNVTDDSEINGIVVINNFEYAKIEKLKKYKTDTLKLKDLYLQQKNIVLSISKTDIRNTNNDSTSLEEKISFTAALNGSGEYKFIPLNLFTILDKNPFIAENRFSEINFGYNRLIFFKGNIKVSDRYFVEGLPEKVNLYYPELNIRLIREIKFIKESNKIEFDIKVDFLKSYYTPSEYAALKNTYKIIFNKLSEQIVLKRK
jgi:Domain of Unknown Function with PDB structure (DUF3857)